MIAALGVFEQQGLVSDDDVLLEFGFGIFVHERDQRGSTLGLVGLFYRLIVGVILSSV